MTTTETTTAELAAEIAALRADIARLLDRLRFEFAAELEHRTKEISTNAVARTKRSRR